MPDGVKKLKKEVKQLVKQNPITNSSLDRMNSNVEDLTRSINSLIDLFKEAGQEMKLEEKEQDLIEKRIVPMEERLNTLIDQNKKIAEGIVAVADMLKSKKAEPVKMPHMPKLPPARPMPPPSDFPPPRGMPPPKGFPPPMEHPSLGDLPPPPGELSEFGDLPPLPGKGSAHPLPPPPEFREKKKKRFSLF